MVSSCVPRWESTSQFKASLILYLPLEQFTEPAPVTWTPPHRVLCAVRKEHKATLTCESVDGKESLQACFPGECIHFHEVLSKAKVFNAEERQLRPPPLLGHALNHTLSTECSYYLQSLL